MSSTWAYLALVVLASSPTGFMARRLLRHNLNQVHLTATGVSMQVVLFWSTIKKAGLLD
jgi:hypothetical protein